MKHSGRKTARREVESTAYVVVNAMRQGMMFAVSKNIRIL